MSCEEYRNRLVDALAVGEKQPAVDVAAHLRACVECERFYESQVNLFGAIDSGVRAIVNEVVPSSLLPRVRARVGEIGVPRRIGGGYWVPVCAALAVVILLGVFLVRPKYTTVRVAVVPTVEFPIPRVDRSRPAREADSFVNGKRRALAEKARIVRHPEVARSIAQVETLQVVVGREEAQGLVMLAANIWRHPELGQALMWPSTTTEDQTSTPRAIKIEDLEVLPLAEQD